MHRSAMPKDIVSDRIELFSLVMLLLRPTEGRARRTRTREADQRGPQMGGTDAEGAFPRRESGPNAAGALLCRLQGLRQ